MEDRNLECLARHKNNGNCSCPKTDCERHGICCECIAVHKNRVDDNISKRFPHCLRDLVKEVIAG